MQRRFLPLLWACTLLLVMTQAASAASYVVAPFQVNGPDGFSYLQKAIPPMLSSRLFWQGHAEPVTGQDAAVQGRAPANRQAAEALRVSSGADYVVWGSVTVLGEEASLDVSVLDAQGSLWQRAVKSPVSNLLGGVQSAAEAISADVFGRSAASGGARAVGPMNPEFMVNESQAGVYLNPEIRYQGTESERLRSQMIDMESCGMEVADLDGDGKNEVLLLGETHLHAYRWENGRLVQIAEYRLLSSVTPLLVRFIEQGGRRLVVLSGHDESSQNPLSSILELRNGSFVEVARRIPFYLNVVELPPMYQKTIITQAGDRSRTVRGPVMELVRQGDKFVRGANVGGLPSEANVFNFVWVPGNEASGGDYLVAVGNLENLLTFNSKASRLAKSDDKYAGSRVGIPLDMGMAGSGRNDNDIERFYYIPIRMLAVDLDRDGQSEVLTVKPISTASQFFHNYRTFPQGEIHALRWDGIGLDLLWKTRRIRGTVVDFTVADVNNDGVLDLAVNVNSYPGALGTGKVRTLVTLYPLDSNRADPNTPPSPDFE